MKKTNSVNVYWEEFPDTGNQIKDVLNPSRFQEPSEILNSTEVFVKSKPWLQKQTNPKLISKKIEIPKNESLEYTKKSISEKEQILCEPARLKDLNHEDKQKIANLIRELAKFSNAKEQAVKQLHEVKDNYTSALTRFQMEKEQAVKKYDLLKEKLLEYEILVEEMKLSAKNQSSQNPGNLENDDKSETSLIDNFSDLFLEQEKKFHHQQNVLQEQIEQLHKLQESILRQQPADQRNIKHNTSFTEIGVNTRKLESYMMSESRHGNNKQGFDSSLNQNAHVDEHRINQSVKNGEVKIPLLQQSTKIKHDIEVQTDINTIDQYKQYIDVSEQTEYPLISKSSCNKTPVKNQSDQLHKPELPKSSLKVVNCSASNSTKRTYSNVQGSIAFDNTKHSSSKNEKNPVVLVSPVQRKHFKPSSMLDLVEGIHPRSTSTSVDQYSMKQSIPLQTKSPNSSRTFSNESQIRHPTSSDGKDLKKINRQSKTQPTKYKSKNMEEVLERNMLDDIFFT